MKPARGFTLVEILIAVLVLTSGILGFAAMQSSSLRLNKSTLLRSEATFRLAEMADRMRANLNAVAAGNYGNFTAAVTQPSACVNNATACTSSEMASQDFYEWNVVNAAILPEGTGVVCIDSTPDDGTPDSPQCDGSGNVYAIKLWWIDDNSDNFRRFSSTFRP